MKTIPANRSITAASLAAILCIAAGCDKEPVESYSVAKAPTPPPESRDTAKPPAPTTDPHGPIVATQGAIRTLAAIAPAGERTWYLKLTGPSDRVAAVAADFERLVKGIDFDAGADEPIAFTHVPEGWTQRGKRDPDDMRHATFILPGGEMEVTVFAFGAQSGSVAANVNRWRGQIGLPAVDDAGLAQVTKEAEVDGVAVTLVDMTGPGMQAAVPSRGNIPPFLARPSPLPEKPAPPPPASPAEDEHVHVDVPAGWSQLDELPPMSVMAFAVEHEGKQLVTTVTRLGGEAGGVLANINRWRGQVGLPPMDTAQLAAQGKSLEIAGRGAEYVDAIGPQGDRILGVIVPRGPVTWFFKLRGPSEQLTAVKGGFDTLVESIEFHSGDEHTEDELE